MHAFKLWEEAKVHGKEKNPTQTHWKHTSCLDWIQIQDQKLKILAVIMLIELGFVHSADGSINNLYE